MLAAPARSPVPWPVGTVREAVQVRTIEAAPHAAAARSELSDELERRPKFTPGSTQRHVTPAAQSAVTAAPISEVTVDPDAGYLGRSALSVVPRALQPVLIDFPQFVGAFDRYAAEFDIFINDTGGVVRVRSLDPTLPPILVQAVRDAFLPARFSPGEVDGRPVRSRFRVEVTFDSQPRQG